MVTLVSLLINIILFISTFFVLVILFYKWSFTYWKRKGAPTLNPTIPFGDLQNHLTRQISRMEELVELYNKVKAKGKITYNLSKTKYCKTILIKSLRKGLITKHRIIVIIISARVSISIRSSSRKINGKQFF